MSLNKVIQIEIEASNPVDLKTKENAINNITKLDAATLEKLSQLATSKKAVEKLNNNWLMIKTMVL